MGIRFKYMLVDNMGVSIRGKYIRRTSRVEALQSRQTCDQGKKKKSSTCSLPDEPYIYLIYGDMIYY